MEELGGHVLCLGEPTVHTGGGLDFAVVSSSLVGHVSIKVDWSAPHRPHASVLFEVRVPGSQEKSLKFPDFQVRDACEGCRLSEGRPRAPEVRILGTNFFDDWISGEFGAPSQWYQEAMYPEEKLWRIGLWIFTVLRGCPHRPQDPTARRQVSGPGSSLGSMP